MRWLHQSTVLPQSPWSYTECSAGAGMRAQQQTHCPTMNGAQHILVVDDEPDLRKLVSDVLTRNGYHVFEAHDGVAMMETMKSSRIDLVILDITMPGEDGLSLCRRLRVAETTPIIMLTATGTRLTVSPGWKWVPTTIC